MSTNIHKNGVRNQGVPSQNGKIILCKIFDPAIQNSSIKGKRTKTVLLTYTFCFAFKNKQKKIGPLALPDGIANYDTTLK